jgi:hypothetical protein
MTTKARRRPGKSSENETIEASCLSFLRAVIDKDRSERGVPLDEVYSAVEMANACASLAGMLLNTVPFGARWELLGAMSRLTVETMRCRR